ncbi:TCP-1/cpn60 chaperonin family protein [Candidatus Bathyarchaeota archaeon]|nr:TCP-1/cpn60 chaperonin family protein [Candidatus Bathyarchaeota archaeon]
MAFPQLSGQPIIILKEDSKRSAGREAQRANIMAARAIVEAVRSSLGPRGMDKMLVDSFGDVTVTNDGATILKEMDVDHPAAKMMVEVAKTQDEEVGDGTTTAVVLAGELLIKAQSLIEKGIHPSIIVEGISSANEKVKQYLDEIAIEVNPLERRILHKIADIALATKFLAEDKAKLAGLVVDAILNVAHQINGKYAVDIEDVKLEKKAGGNVSDTRLIRGLVIDKEVVHSRMPKRVDEARIALIVKPFEIEKPEFDSKLTVEKPEQLDAFIRKEEQLLEEMVERLSSAGANVLLCQRGIDDSAQHHMAKRGILAVRRVKVSDMERLAKATGGRIVTDVAGLEPSDLGYAETVEERKIGDDKMLFIEGCKSPRAVTIFIRGGAERIVNEAERALHDALCAVRDVVRDPRIVAGGGAPEVEVSRRLREYSRSVRGREQLAVMAFADALEGIPLALAENAGLDPVDILVELRARHDRGQVWAGIDPFGGTVRDMRKAGVLEPLSVKAQAVASAIEAACMILRIDDVVAAGRSGGGPSPPKTPEEGPGEAEES